MRCEGGAITGRPLGPLPPDSPGVSGGYAVFLLFLSLFPDQGAQTRYYSLLPQNQFHKVDLGSGAVGLCGGPSAAVSVGRGREHTVVTPAPGRNLIIKESWTSEQLGCFRL